MTKHQRNLRLLADHIDNVDQENFSMETYGIYRGHNCETVACALGHAPYVHGLGTVDDDHNNSILNWEKYSKRVFGLDYTDEEWLWCFSCSWESYDNTPKGAAKRIRYMLKHGVPEGFDHPEEVFNFEEFYAWEDEHDRVN